jgi:hypothetical protein
MKSLADALDRAIPRFQQFGMCQSQLAAATYLGHLLFAQFVRLIAEQFLPILLEPDRKPLSFFRCQAKNRVFQLFHAHRERV